MKHKLFPILVGCLMLGACSSTGDPEPTAVSSQPSTLSSESAATVETTPIAETATPEPTAAPTPTEIPVDPLGMLSMEHNIVEHGPDVNALEAILETAPFFEEDFIRVTEGGEALLDFGDQMLMRLFNDTELEVVSAEIAEDVPLGVQAYLFLGGFTGQLTADGGRAVYETPGGVEITVLGTDYFVTYDPETEVTTVGSFEGTVQVESADTVIDLDDGSYVIVPAEQPPGAVLPLPLTLEEYENEARETASPLSAVERAKVWSLNIRHEWALEDQPSTHLAIWSGRFSLDGEAFVGEGLGTITDHIMCPDVARTEFDIDGSFDFHIQGQLTTGEDGRPAFQLEISGANLQLNSTHPDTKGCSGFYDIAIAPQLSILALELPSVAPGGVLVEAANDVTVTRDLDGSAHDLAKSIYFETPLEVTVGPATD